MNTQTFIARIPPPKTLAGRLRTACTTSLLPLLLLPLPAAVQAQFTFTTNNDTITITGYSGPGGAVTIPDTINDLPVSSIGFEAFCGCSNLTSVTIPNTVTNIADRAFIGCGRLAGLTLGSSVASVGDYAFQACSSLTDVTFPNSVISLGTYAFSGCISLVKLTIGSGVTTIRDMAFYECTSLTDVVIPNSVTNIGRRVFEDCPSLTGLTVDTSNPAYSSADRVLFNKNQTTLVEYLRAEGGGYTIPASVTCIGDYAFNGCSKLTSVTIPDGLTSIGNYAFNGCASLTSVSIPDSVTNVAEGAFAWCTSLTSVTLGHGVTGIEEYGFADCPLLLRVEFKGDAPSIGPDVFYLDTSATVYYQPGTIGWSTTFGGRPTALWQPPPPGAWTLSAGSITTNSATLNGTVNPNGYATAAWFQWGTTTSYGNLTAATDMGSGTNDLPLSAALAGLTLGATYHYRVAATNSYGTAYGSDQSFTTAVPLSEFNYTINNGTITITGYTGPGGGVIIPDVISGYPVTTIGASAFSGCTTLTGITIPNSVTSIGDYAFWECFDLINVSIGSNVTSIGAGAFLYDTNLTAITVDALNSTYSSVDGVLFNKSQTTLIHCPNGKAGSFIIPGSVIDILESAFYFCTSLTSVRIPDGITSIRDFTFRECSSLTSVTIPSSVTRIGIGAFAWCTSLGSVTIGPNVTSIGDIAFQDCARLMRMYFKGNAPSLGSDVFYHNTSVIVYYLLRTTGWSTTFGGRPTALWQQPTPEAGTLAASSITTNGATLNGTINPNGCPTAAWFLWGTSTSYGNLTAATNMGSGTGNVPLAVALTGLIPGVTYHFCVAATNDNGLVYGSDQSFTTRSLLAPFSDAGWVNLGSGIDIKGSVYALAVSGTDLYVGGGFTTAGGVPASNIAKWDGGAWSVLGSGMDREVWALAVSGSNLYAGGYFALAGGMPAKSIAKWDGRAWSTLDSGVNGSVSALAVSGTTLYAAGSFTTAGGVPATNIARWNGTAWSALGSGVNGGVRALAMSGTDLYAAGTFNMAGGVPAMCIAKWDGRAWSALGSGVNDAVWALAVSGTDLYAGGFFTIAGGVQVSNIAKWNGSTWSSLGTLSSPHHMIPGVCALAVSGNNLYVGGWFTNAGGVSAANIAQWDGRAWSALGSGVNDVVIALAIDEADHLFAGGNFTVAGTNVSPHIAQANLGSAPTILRTPQAQTAEAGATVVLTVAAIGTSPLAYQWYLNGTNLPGCTSGNLVLTNLLLSDSGTYTVAVTNANGSVTSAPVMVNVIAPVVRRVVPGVKVTAPVGTSWSLDYRSDPGPAASWETMATISLSSTSQFYFDLTLPLPSQRFYQAWQAGTPGVRPSLDLHLVPAITLTGAIGHSVRVDAINQFGTTDAWITLATELLTNTPQLYFDTSAWGQPPRLYRLLQVP
jgi:hypothetical protein